LSKSEAAQRLGISERTLDRMDPGPECRMRPRKGKRPEPVFHPQDVDALVAASAPKPRLNPPAMPASYGTDLAPVENDGMPPGLVLAVKLVEQLATIAQRSRPEPASAPL